MFNRLLDDTATPAQRKAHHALTLLLSEEGIDSASDVYTNVLAWAREEAFTVRHGLSRCTGTVCLSRLFGGRCRHINGESNRTPHVPPSNAHPSLWARDNQPVIYVFQPYKDAITADALERLAEFCQEYGLVFTISEEQSFHYPGKTTLVIIERLRSAWRTLRPESTISQ